MDPLKLSVVVPAYNEEDNLHPLVNDILEALGDGPSEIILVDDNSSDGTADLCDNLAASNPRISCIHRRKGDNGMGYALIEGSRAAKGEYVVWVMADRSDNLVSIREIVKKLDEGFDMVVASRYMSGGSRGELGIDKAMYGSTYTKLARLIFGLPIHDATNAYRGFRRKILEKAKIESGDFAISPEFAIKAHLAGFRLSEVPTTYFDRRAGQPKFNMLRMGLRYVSLFRLRLGYRRKT
ncbi:MAG: glycosyltransferase [Candidatus Altiarchaeota archaeon]